MRNFMRKALKLNTWLFTIKLLFLGFLVLLFNEPLTNKEAFIFASLCILPCLLVSTGHIIRFTIALLKITVEWVIAVLTMPLNIARLAADRRKGC